MLLDGPEMDVKTKQDWHSHPLLGIYKFFNVRGQEEVNRTKSRKNVTECRVAMAIYARLRQEFKGFDYELSVGVVTPYAAQVGEMKRQFATRFGNDIKDKVQIQSVDGFQGQEKDVIIFSCVRAGPSLESIGHLAGQYRHSMILV
jgi:senataxin